MQMGQNWWSDYGSGDICNNDWEIAWSARYPCAFPLNPSPNCGYYVHTFHVLSQNAVLPPYFPNPEGRLDLQSPRIGVLGGEQCAKASHSLCVLSR
jgi:hypothetical protein